MLVKWGSTISANFTVTNGVRDGGVLSPKLLNIYMDGLSIILNGCNIGGATGWATINHMLYADDLCIISTSSSPWFAETPQYL